MREEAQDHFAQRRHRRLPRRRLPQRFPAAGLWLCGCRAGGGRMLAGEKGVCGGGVAGFRVKRPREAGVLHQRQQPRKHHPRLPVAPP